MLERLKSFFSAAKDASPPASAKSAAAVIADHKGRGNMFLGEGRLEEAGACYRQAMKAAPDDADVYINMGYILMEQKQYEQAENYLKQAIAINPEGVDAFYMLGTMAREKGDLPEAIEHFNQVLGRKPDFEIVYSDLCLALFQDGRLADARLVIEKGISLYPATADFHYYLGNLHFAGKDHEQAMASFRTALSIRPDYAEVYNNLGMALQAQGNLDAAAENFRKALVLQPGSVDGYTNLGRALHAQDKLDEAAQSYRQALAIHPDLPEVHNSYGQLLQAEGKLDAAIESYEKALVLKPEWANTHFNLGGALQISGRLDAAIQAYESALKIKPEYAEANLGLGSVLQEQGKLDAAIDCYRLALRQNQQFAEAHLNLGSALQSLGRLDEAVDCYQRSLTFAPEYTKAHLNLGTAFQGQSRLDEAIECYQRALALNPEYADAYVNMGSAFQMKGQLAVAVDSYRKAIAIRPELAIAYSNLLFTLSFQSESSAGEYVAEAKRYGTEVIKQAQPYREWVAGEGSKSGGRRLRVGLVSGDLRAHPVGYFLEGILAHLDPDRVELAAYLTLSGEDALSERIKPRFWKWDSIVGLSDQSAAQKIHDDGIDILMDLSGHTAHNRLPVFGWKPAPVQASWLGYWASTGMPGIDYLLADPISVPESHRVHFTETVWHLPDTRLCFTPPAAAGEVKPLPALRNGHITFGSFQNTMKVTDAVLVAWARILAALPRACLRLQSKQMSQASERVALQQRLERAGIAPERVTMVGATGMDEYFAAHGEVDIILDTYPFPGGTTTCEALWMGVPTITLAGDTLLGRQGVSMLTCAGLEEWIAGNEEEYVACAVAHAGNTDRLAKLRAGLREQVRASPLFDGLRFARHLDDALHGMWGKEMGI
jgi:protein O-GlcNAc transferase